MPRDTQRRRFTTFQNAIEPLERRTLFATLPGGFSESIIATVSQSPTAMTFTPDGRVLVAEEAGAIRVIQNNTLLGTPAITIPTDTFFERGLLGITVDPNFSSNGYVYTYHSNPSGSPIRQHLVTRWTMVGNTINSNTGVTLLAIPMGSAGNHNGGAINFGPDGKLYIAVGDSGPVPSQPQGLNTLYGKILRINPDGTIPTDNPYYFQTTGEFRSIWALGFRNPFTFAFQPGTGRMFINDVGSSGAGRREEVNEGFAGANYGWPVVEGFRTSQNVSGLIGPYVDPVHAYTAGQAITGGAFYNPQTPMFPAAYVGDYFFGDYVSGTIRTLDASLPPPYINANNFGTGASGPLDFDVAPDGSLWYLEYNTNQVRRIFVNTSSQPSISNHPTNQTVSISQPATFTVVAGGPNLSYQWQRNNQDILGANGVSYTVPNPQLVDSGSTYRVIVSNGNGSVTSNSATLTVVNNQLPNPTITAPSGALLWVGGVPVNFAGTATDPEDGTLPASAFTWEIKYITGLAAPRPFVPPTTGITSGSFTPATQTPYTDPDVAYRIILTVRDSAGYSRSVSQDVLPRTANITLNSAGAPVQLPLLLDVVPYNTPYTFLGVAGVIRQLEAPASQTVNGQTYNFVSWSNGGPRQQAVSTPQVDTTFTATYLDVTRPVVNSTNFLFDGNTLPSAPHRLVVEFSENVGASLAISDFQLFNLTTSQTIAPANMSFTYSSGTNRATITFPGLPGQILPDGNYRLTINAGDVSDAAGNTLLNNYVFQNDFWFFNGDVNRDRTVNGQDFNILAPNFGQSPRIWSQGDLNYDGTVNGLDFNILAPKFGTSLPAPFARPGNNPPSGGGGIAGGGDGSRGGIMRWGAGPGAAPFGGSFGSSSPAILAPLGFKTPASPFGDDPIGLPTDGGGKAII